MSSRAEDKANAFPITKILAVGTMSSTVTEDDVRNIMPTEVRETVALYLAGRIDQWFAQHGGGVLFLLNLDDIDAAAEMLASLPLAKAGFMTFKLTALGPLFPLHGLLQS